MKIARAIIENFRHISRIELEFTDSLGRVRDTSLFIGPNASGKTTILDALAVGVGLGTELSYGRPGMILSPRTIVSKGSLFTRVTCWVRFSAAEISTTRELFLLAEEGHRTVPDAEEVKLTWTYPDPRGRSEYGFTDYHPSWAWTLFKGRKKVAHLLSTGRVGWNWFERVGSVFTFDQQRVGLGQTIPRDIWEIIEGQGGNGEAQGSSRLTSDPRKILLNLAVLSLVGPSSGLQQLDQFERIKERYAQVCAPHRLVGAVRDELGLDLLFNDGTYDYRYDGLSSGEQMLLLFLIRMVSQHIHQSIVLVDEIELHQHPIWQRKLLHLLPKMGEGNQIIATTHSPYLREVTPPEAVIELGEVLEPAFAPAD